MTRRIAVVIFPGFQLLDAAGPIGAFEIAERYEPGAYELWLLAAEPGEVESSSGVKMAADGLGEGRYDTIMVVGGDGTRSLPHLVATIAWLKTAARRARRVASVCSGAYLLAEAGLLDGRRATTHWGRTDDFERRYPKVILDADRIYIRDGDVWTSAGITAGIDPHAGAHRGRPGGDGRPANGAAARGPSAPAWRSVAILGPCGRRRRERTLRRADGLDARAPGRAPTGRTARGAGGDEPSQLRPRVPGRDGNDPREGCGASAAGGGADGRRVDS